MPCSLQDREQLPQFGKVSNAKQIEMMACQWQSYSDGGSWLAEFTFPAGGDEIAGESQADR